ncbi:MAG: FG-GAP repeat domain-containing protein [Nitrospirales bacterium]
MLFSALVLLLSCTPEDPYVPPDAFYLYASYDVGRNPTSVTTADFNHDGLTDLITTNIGNNSLSILFGNGDGSFERHVQLQTGKQPRALGTNDFNGDGWLDVAVACSGGDEISIFFGRDDGKFLLVHRYPVHRTPVSITAGDFNGDQRADLAVALRNDKVKILLGDGTGAFRPGVEYQYGDTPTTIASADLSSDGVLDLAVSNGGPMSSAVSIWIGKGDGTFHDPVDYRTGKRPLTVDFADFNKDRRLDLLVVNGEMDTFTVFLGNGDGTFQQGIDSGADAGPVYGLARDFNGDDLPDVAIVNIQSNDLSILYGKGNGKFRYPPKNYRANGGPFAIASLTLTNKEMGEPALVTANNGSGSISIFLHRGLRSLPRSSPS